MVGHFDCLRSGKPPSHPPQDKALAEENRNTPMNKPPSVEESVAWLDEVLSSGVPAGFDVEQLDRMARARERSGRYMARLGPLAIAVGLVGVVFVLLWVAAVTNSTIAAVCGGFSVITFVRFLMQWWKFERSLHKYK